MTTAWPDRFVYVCSATFANNVNLVPLRHAGMSRVEKVYILCGARQDSRDPTDISQAINPARYLQRTLEKWFQNEHRADSVTILYCKSEGDAERASVWADIMKKILHENSTDLPIFYNVTGGMRMMVRGATLGGGDRLQLLYVSPKPLRTQFLNGLEQTEAPMKDHLLLYELLTARNYKIKNYAESVIIANWYVSEKVRIESFAQQWNKHRYFGGHLNALAGQLFKGDNFIGGTIDVSTLTDKRPKKWLGDLLRTLKGLEGINETAMDRFQVTDADVAKFLTGRWLEGWIYNRLQSNLARFGNSKSFEIVTGLAFALREADIGEFDVAVVIAGQLHVIEAKTGKITGEGEPAVRILRQSADIREILGQHGQYIVVNPRVAVQDLLDDTTEFLDRCTRKGVALLVGPTAVDTVIQTIVKLVEAS